MNQPTNNITVTPENYYDVTAYDSFSGLKTFSKCPNLFREQFLEKTYVEPEQDYFIYGQIVDIFLTEGGHDGLAKKFLRVTRRVSPEDIADLRAKIAKAREEIESMGLEEKVAKGNKTAIKGLESRNAIILKCEEEINIASGALNPNIKQVVASLYDDALVCAAAISTNPTFKTLEFTQFTSQQVFVNEEKGIKGKLDYVRFHPVAQRVYELWKTGLIKTQEEFRTQMDALPLECRRGVIIDIKTTARLREVDPDIWSGQLACYQDLVTHVTGIKCDCYIVVGDKTDQHHVQDFIFSQERLDFWKPTIYQYLALIKQARATNVWESAKELEGINQSCWKCSACAQRPFSTNQPFLVTGSLKDMKTAQTGYGFGTASED